MQYCGANWCAKRAGYGFMLAPETAPFQVISQPAFHRGDFTFHITAIQRGEAMVERSCGQPIE
jgi:hypothetical protein